MRAETVLEESIATKEAMRRETDLLETVERVGAEMVAALEDGHKVLLFGNGGSAADAQHIAAELAGKFRAVRPGLPALALTTNTSSLTAIANDFDYGTVFARQVDAVGQDGDVAVGISTSGTSENVVAGVREANAVGATTVGLTGRGGGELGSVADYCVGVPSEDTARIQEAHITVGHILSGHVEAELFG
jgi:D-sedoheptulose 7-phosphate isomerase